MYDDKFPSIQRQSYHPIKTLALDYRRPLTSICRASQKYHNKVWSTHFPLLSCAPLGKRQSPRIMIHFHQACSYGQFGWLSPTVDHASVFQDHESNTYCARPSIHSTTTSARFCLLLRSVADAAHRLLVQPLGRKRRSASLPPSLKWRIPSRVALCGRGGRGGKGGRKLPRPPPPPLPAFDRPTDRMDDALAGSVSMCGNLHRVLLRGGRNRRRGAPCGVLKCHSRWITDGRIVQTDKSLVISAGKGVFLHARVIENE